METEIIQAIKDVTAVRSLGDVAALAWIAFTHGGAYAGALFVMFGVPLLATVTWVYDLLTEVFGGEPK